MYGYYGYDACTLDFTEEQLAAIGLGNLEDKDLGLGDSCVNIDKIFSDFTPEELDEGITLEDLAIRYGTDYQYVWMKACAENTWWYYSEYCNQYEYYWDYRSWQDLSWIWSDADWSWLINSYWYTSWWAEKEITLDMVEQTQCFDYYSPQIT